MNRHKKWLITPAVAIPIALFAAAPASAGGNPPFESCGLGKTLAHAAIANQTSPGATEFSRLSPLAGWLYRSGLGAH